MSEPYQQDNERYVGDETPPADKMKEMLANIREHLATTGPFTWGNTSVDPPWASESAPDQEVDHGMEM